MKRQNKSMSERVERFIRHFLKANVWSTRFILPVATRQEAWLTASAWASGNDEACCGRRPDCHRRPVETDRLVGCSPARWFGASFRLVIERRRKSLVLTSLSRRHLDHSDASLSVASAPPACFCRLITRRNDVSPNRNCRRNKYVTIQSRGH